MLGDRCMIIDHADNFRILTNTMAEAPEKDASAESLDSLEKKISNLIESWNALVENNARLHKKQSFMIEQIAELLRKNKAVNGKINVLVQRLKQLERSV